MLIKTYCRTSPYAAIMVAASLKLKYVDIDITIHFKMHFGKTLSIELEFCLGGAYLV